MSITKDFYSVFVLTNEHKPVKKLDECVFALSHGEEYKIKIVNHHINLRANASISIDGKNIGYFRINSNSSIIIERPAKQERRLTFYKRGTKEAIKGGLECDNAEQGILRVTIEQEKEPEVSMLRAACLPRRIFCEESDCAEESYCAGGTALGRASSQRFSNASNMITKDEVTVVRALMVVDNGMDNCVDVVDDIMSL